MNAPRPNLLALELVLLRLADHHVAAGVHAQHVARHTEEPQQRRLLFDIAEREADLASRIHHCRRDAPPAVRSARLPPQALHHLDHAIAARGPGDVLHGCMEASLLVSNWLRRVASRTECMEVAHLLVEVAAAHEAHAERLGYAYAAAA